MISLVEKLFWLASATIAYTFFGYPILVTLVARFRDKTVLKSAITPQVTLLIPVYNEALVIAEKIENSLNLDYPSERIDIVIVDSGSEDDTAGIAARYPEVLVHSLPERQGKAAAINWVVPRLDSDIIVFTDANTLLGSNTLKAIVRNFADPAVGGVAGEKQVLGGGEGLYWRYESYLKRCDSQISSVMGAAGECFAIRREAFEPTEEDTIIEDFVISMRLVTEGWRVVYEPEAIAYEMPSKSLVDDWERRTRNSAGGFQAISRLSSILSPRQGIVAWQYVSHRVMRWAVAPFMLPVVFVLNLFLFKRTFYRFLLIGQTLFYLTGLLGYYLTRIGNKSGFLQTIFYFCFANLAAIAGFSRYITKRQPVTWTKAER